MQLEDGQEHALQRQERRRRARATAVLNHILVDILFMAEKLSRTKPAMLGDNEYQHIFAILGCPHRLWKIFSPSIVILCLYFTQLSIPSITFCTRFCDIVILVHRLTCVKLTFPFPFTEIHIFSLMSTIL